MDWIIAAICGNLRQLAAICGRSIKSAVFRRFGELWLAIADTLMLDPPGEQKVGLPVHFVEGNAAFCRQFLERSIYVFDG